MKSLKSAFGLAVFITVLAAAGFFLRAQTCDTNSASVTGYAGGNDSTLDTDSMTGITNDTSALLLRLNQKGANFIPGSDYPVTGNNRMTGAAADFNNDGFVDLVEGGRATDYNTNGSLGNRNAADSNIAFYVSRGKDPGNSERFLFEGPYYLLYAGSALNATYEIIACGAGDYDRDGDADIAVLSWQGRLFIFKNLYIENSLAPGGTPVFSTTPTFLGDLINDGYGEWGQGGDHFRWESNIESVDIDRDNDLDLIVGVPQRYATGRWGEVVIFINNGSGVFSRLITTINPYPNNSSNIYGVCGVAAADFDRDGDIDFYVGSANSRSIYFYRNDGLGNFSPYNPRTLTIASKRGTCTMLRAGNMDGDLDVDLVLATDGHNTNTPGGYVFWYKNDGAGVMTAMSVPTDGSQLSSSGDLDSGAIGDFDKDGDLDFFVADGNDSRQCYFIMNESYPLYVDTGTVPSRNLLPCSFLTSDNAVVSATIHARDEKLAGTTITYYLSNSDDDNGNPKWEGPVTNNVEYVFASPGQFLRWKAEFRSTDETKTPKIFSITLDYKYIGKREYSRTSQAHTMAEVNSSSSGEEEVLYAASFEFPTWKGHLRSWDVTALTLAANRYSQLSDILDVGADFVADAGEILSTRSYSSRWVFTAYDAGGDGVMNDRLDFSASEVTTLDNFLGLGEGSPEAVPLINFVLGDGRNWKLGDINHSSPQALDPPSEDAAQMGSGYDVFKAFHASRQKTILVGANDGMLHCFNADSLEEMWAFIPNNLLYKLKRMRVIDPDCGVFLQHQFFVDGTPAIQDVFFGGSWHTVLVCGQGPGWGKGGKCYYFALDVTDPVNPQPLWEFTHETMGETWSVPVIGRVESENKWYVFFGSGYDVDPVETLGNNFYALDVETGALVRAFEMAASPHDPASPFGIQNTLPGSPAAVDSNLDGSIEAVYIGDLLGRIWKLDLSPMAVDWTPAVIYEDPFNYPIVTKPAIGVDSTSRTVRLYFGTGGDEKATDASYYSFICLADTNPVAVDWYMGPQALADRLHLADGLKKDELAQGEKVWADPVLSGNFAYIATLYGSIESLNPCLTLAGIGKIYARYATGAKAGESALIGSGGTPIGFLQTKQKVRSAVTIGKSQKVDLGGSQQVTKSKVYIQSYTRPEINPPEPPSQVLAQPSASGGLIIKSWREVYRIRDK